ncbi:MAG TPA: hypothetical protein VFO59_04900, partial [Dehalococcoidia bacterium]|nr:hypothetical protein [Dehalococcoidia bacterium]
LNGFLDARVAGAGAQQYLFPPEEDIPLLYATTSGASYERGEFQPVRDVEWPYGYRVFKVRLFAGDTVVEQLFFTPYDLALYPSPPEAADARLRLDYGDNFGADIAPTTEDGQPLPVSYNAFDGEVIVHITHPWVIVPVSGGYSIRRIPEGAGVGPTTDASGRLVVMVDPARDGAGCPAGPNPADAETLAESIRSDPGLEATAPLAVDAGGAEGLMMDVEIAAGTKAACGGFYGDTGYRSDGFPARPIGLGTGDRMRLYLFDAPEELDVRILAIMIKAPKSGFERAVEGAPPPVEFHAQ